MMQSTDLQMTQLDSRRGPRPSGEVIKLFPGQRSFGKTTSLNQCWKVKGSGRDRDPTSHCGPGGHSVLDAVNAIKVNITSKYTSIVVAMVYG